MIVNPQLFNYRLFSGTLLVAIVALSIYSYTNFEENRAQQDFLKQEKNLIANELSDMLVRYDEMIVDNDELEMHLQSARTTAKNALDSIFILQGDVKVYSKYRRQLASLRKQNIQLFHTVDSLQDLAIVLERDNEIFRDKLEESSAENLALKEENEELNQKLTSASKIYINNFNVKAFTNNKGRRLETRRATSASSIEVCMTLTENVLTESGEKELYIQIVNPRNNVVADKGAVTFGDATLIYSAKNTVFYDNAAKDICVNVKADEEDRPLEKGLYYVNVFHKAKKIANTKIILD